VWSFVCVGISPVSGILIYIKLLIKVLICEFLNLFGVEIFSITSRWVLLLKNIPFGSISSRAICGTVVYTRYEPPDPFATVFSRVKKVDWALLCDHCLSLLSYKSNITFLTSFFYNACYCTLSVSCFFGVVWNCKTPRVRLPSSSA